MHLSRVFIVLSLVVAALALAAWGDDDDSEPANTT
jgi:hypothetical protein